MELHVLSLKMDLVFALSFYLNDDDLVHRTVMI